VEVVDLGPQILLLDDNDLAADEIKFGDGSKAEKRYKVKILGQICRQHVAKLTGKIRAKDKAGNTISTRHRTTICLNIPQLLIIKWQVYCEAR